MKINSRTFLFAAAALLCMAATGTLAQNKADYSAKHREFCSNDNYSSGDRMQYRDLRESTVPATGEVSVSGGQNGGVRVIGENRSDILVRACVQTWGTTDAEAKAVASNIRIETGGTIKAEGTPAENKNWSVSFELTVPRNSNLNLTAHNGGISIENVDGSIQFETTNGGVHLNELAGDVRGRTTNGGLHIELSGNSWKGNGLDVQTINGGVSLELSSNYAAHIETGTVNGGFQSDFAALNVDRKERSRAARISTDLNGGGAPIRVVTTNGGIRINSSERSSRN
jgi:DUF4097 and DUF4098 domain-containing protein YvlB